MPISTKLYNIEQNKSDLCICFEGVCTCSFNYKRREFLNFMANFTIFDVPIKYERYKIEQIFLAISTKLYKIEQKMALYICFKSL